MQYQKNKNTHIHIFISFRMFATPRQNHGFRPAGRWSSNPRFHDTEQKNLSVVNFLRIDAVQSQSRNRFNRLREIGQKRKTVQTKNHHCRYKLLFQGPGLPEIQRDLR